MTGLDDIKATSSRAGSTAWRPQSSSLLTSFRCAQGVQVIEEDDGTFVIQAGRDATRRRACRSSA